MPSASSYPLHVVPLTDSSEQRERVHGFRSGEHAVPSQLPSASSGNFFPSIDSSD
ncbi:MAG: hypothetical protein LBQ54_13835 [Planctomycetaceae bacterium]|nr:hypothetical protein [Planctomycetaceae bacterium]